MKYYSRKSVAETRMLTLMKRSVAGLSVEYVKSKGWKVVGDPGLTPQEPSQFGLLLENDKVLEAALAVDEALIGQYDTGETHARPASEIYRQLARQQMGLC